MTDYRVRFVRDVQVEKAPAPGKSGFVIETIEAGTEKTISDHSLKFWQDREQGKKIIEILGKVREGERAAPSAPKEQVIPPVPNPVTTSPTKTDVRKVAESALAFLLGDLRETGSPLAEAIGLLLTPEVAELLEVQKDTRDVLEAALEDLQRDSTLAQASETRDALDEIRNLTLPPSKRK